MKWTPFNVARMADLFLRDGTANFQTHLVDKLAVVSLQKPRLNTWG